MNLENKNVLVAGIARTGIAASNLLARNKARVMAVDDKREEDLKENLAKLDKRVRVQTGRIQGEDITDFDLIIVSPGIDMRNPLLKKAVEKGIPVWSEIELASRFIKKPIIAITGTNGKTTSTSMIGNILKNSGEKIYVGGNIGFPLSNIADQASQYSFIVLEVSSFQLEWIDQFKPFISAILNITEDHLDRHLDFNEYVSLKKRMFRNQKEKDYLILNKDDPVTACIEPENKIQKLLFSRIREVEDGAFLRKDNIIIRLHGKEKVIGPVSKLKVKGIHNIENGLASALLGALCKVKAETVMDSLSRFTGIDHRMEFVREINGVRFINDSKGTNTGATMKSIESFDCPIILIAGGKDKGGNYGPLAELISKKVKFSILIGESKMKIRSALKNSNNIENAATLEDAVNKAFAKANAGDVVLLSPSCASFDMFKDYEDRGNIFKKAVLKLPGNNN
ncbi:MAG: UDP-N-acetylmuramoyl-L-alanine--D-glutamate ligase [Nitrospinota bacterium]|nr:UDP-N-acetylmuramoyl-L-alanine--D-glutamate ligase [Nitrospinota bacterium]